MEIKLIKGLIAPILTPFDNNLKLDQKMYNDLAKDLMENGCSGLAPFGTQEKLCQLVIKKEC